MQPAASKTLGQSIRNSSQWLLGGSIGNQVVEFAIGVVLARLLVPGDFGLLVTVQVYSGIAGFIANAGLGQALIRAPDVDERHFRVGFTMQMLTGCGIYTFFFLTSPLFSVWYQEPMFTELMRVSAISFLIRPISGIASARLSRSMRFKPQALISFGARLLIGPSSILMAYCGLGVWSLVLPGIIGAFAGSIALCRAARWWPRFAFDPAVARSLAGFGAKMTVADFLDYLRGQTNNFLLGRLATPTAVGLFNKADSLAAMPMMLSGSVYQPTFRALSALQDDLDRSKYLYLRANTLVLVYTLPLYVGLWFSAGPFIEVVYGQQWVASARPLQIIALGGLFRCLMNQAGAVVAAQNRLGAEILMQAETIVLTAVGAVVGIRWGIDGVAVGLLLAITYLAFRITRLALRLLQATLQDLFRAIRPALILNTLLALVLFVADRFLLAGLLPAQPAVYLTAMVTVGGASYLLAFFSLPIADLASEVERWRKQFGWVRKGSGRREAGGGRWASTWLWSAAGVILLAAGTFALWEAGPSMTVLWPRVAAYLHHYLR